MKKKTIKFFREDALTNVEFLDKPKSSKFYIPKWYKDSELYSDEKNYPHFRSNGELGIANVGLKRCIPFLDSLTHGYMFETAMDLIVEINENGLPTISWGGTPSPITERFGKVGSLIPRPSGHHNNHFAWQIPFGFKTPDGYSCLLTHPLNRFDLPFTTTSGIIDSDKYSSGGFVPFFLKNNFEGIIPAGTPYAQIVLIKRDNWKSVMDIDLEKNTKKLRWQARSFYTGFYKNNFWQRKSFE
jgi:hypothetical protein